MSTNCGTGTKKNLGPGSNFCMPQLIRGMITTPQDFSFSPADYADDATFKAAIQAAILAGQATRIYFWPFFVGTEPAHEDAVYEDTPLSDLPVRDGKYRWRFYLRNSMYIHTKLSSHRGGNQRAFLIDNNGKIFGYQDATDGEFYGFSLNLLHNEKMIMNDGANASKSPIYIVLTDTEEIDNGGEVKDVPFINTVKRIHDVTLADFDEATPDTVITFSVRTTVDGISVAGLVAADFTFLTAAGAAQAPDTVTYDATAELYTATRAASFVDGTVDLKAPSALSIQAYESLGALDIEIA